MIEGFEKVTDIDIHRILLSLEGREKRGKTHFALSAPGPIAVFDLDRGLEGVARKFVTKKEIYKTDYRAYPRDAAIEDFKGGDRDPAMAQYTAIWEAFRSDYHKALESDCRTIVWDTADELWLIIRLARLGGKAKAIHYGPINAEYLNLVDKAYDHDKNLILVHKASKEYRNDNWTGNYKRSGFTHTGFAVHVSAKCYRIDPDPEIEDDEVEFGIHIIECRQNMALMNEELTGPLCSFPFLAALVFPDTEVADWE